MKLSQILVLFLVASFKDISLIGVDIKNKLRYLKFMLNHNLANILLGVKYFRNSSRSEVAILLQYNLPWYHLTVPPLSC